MRLKQLRKEVGINQADLVKSLNISLVSYGRYENELREPDLKTLIKLADYYHVTLDYLVGRPFASDVGYLTDNEKELLNVYRSLSKNNQITFLAEGKGMQLIQNSN